jgi:hypothetical protein
MSHIFISYARKDKKFVDQIAQALASDGSDVWIDDRIPKGEDWEQEIYRNIDEAEAFLFMLSPDSVVSEMCNEEIAHAVTNGKRILPILIRDTEHQSIPEAIRKPNWIFCRDRKDDFEKAINEAREAIQTDYEWVIFHTQLQNKAIAWERSKKDTSRLLRGKELREADERLAESGSEKDPQPTNLQHQYLLNSQKAEKRRRRRTAIAWSIIVLLSLIAGVAGFYFFDRTPATVQVEGQVFEIRNRSDYRFLSKDVGSTIAVYAEPQKLTPDDEYLIIIGTGSDGERPGTLLAYDMGGKIQWEYSANEDPYDGPTANFFIKKIIVDQIMNDGDFQIVFTTQKTDWYPSELVLLNADGEVISSYWNSGFIYDVIPQDFDGDKIKELVVSAVNNNLGYVVVNDDTKHPVIVYVLSPKDDFTGQTFPDLIPGVPSGTEYHHWIAVLEPYLVGGVKVRMVSEAGENLIEVVINPEAGYIYLDRFGRIQRVGLSDGWRSKYPDTSPSEFICFLQSENGDWYFPPRVGEDGICPWYVRE